MKKTPETYPWQFKKERMAIAEKLRGMGMSAENIAQATGLSVEELKRMSL